jgi:hypothetical protein
MFGYNGQMELDALRRLVEEQQGLMVKVATHEAGIDDVQAEYKERRRKIAAELKRRGLDDPNPFGDLWDWYEYWREHLPGYVDRRRHVRRLYQQLHDAIDNLPAREIGSCLEEEPTGWDRVDEQIAQLREKCATARTVDDFKGIGHLCREVFVSLASACFDPARHWPKDEEPPAGVKERLDAAVEKEAAGSDNKKMRKALKAHLDVANALQHDQAAPLEEAMIVAELTVSSVRVLRILLRGLEPIEERSEQGDEDWLAALLREGSGPGEANPPSQSLPSESP